MDNLPRVIAVKPQDFNLKTSDVAEKIISAIMDYGEADVIGYGDAMFLACSAINMTTEIANVQINEAFIDQINDAALGKTAALTAHLSQTKIVDIKSQAETQDKELTEDQTVSVSRGLTTEKLVTICLLKLSRYDKIKLMAAGGAIYDAAALALKLTLGNISKDTLGIKLIDIYSIISREDKTRKITAASIYLQKNVQIEVSQKHREFLEKLNPTST
jgi:hypothetical protein